MPAAEPKLLPVYFDSALIAKFYLNEPGRELVRQIARSAGAVVSSGIEQGDTLDITGAYLAV